MHHHFCDVAPLLPEDLMRRLGVLKPGMPSPEATSLEIFARTCAFLADAL